MGTEIIDELIVFAKKYHRAFSEMSDSMIKKLFETYKATTLVHRENGEIHGFAIYQEWPDLLNFICIAGKTDDRLANVKTLLDGQRLLSKKRIVFFDDNKMELIELWKLQ